MKMAANLWVAIILTLLVNNVSMEETDCPAECRCRDQLNSVFMSCKSLDIKLQKGVDMSIGHFLLHSDKPVSLDERIFANIGLKGVNSITIINSHVARIHKNAFRDLPYLTEVRITHTNVTELPADVFYYNNNLKKVNISNNPLGKIDGFVKSGSIEEIDMSNSQIESVSVNTFKYLPKLTLIDMNRNKLSSLDPSTFDALEELSEVRLGNNKLTEVPSDIFSRNKRLEALYLNDNPIVEFSIDTLPSILNLHGCKLSSLDTLLINNVEDISNLDLSNNEISDVKNVFSRMSSLSIVNLAGNKLQDLSTHGNMFQSNLKLEKIILDNNPMIKSLPANGFNINNMSSFNVHWFSCENCGLESLADKTFETMPAILTLTLSHNKISDIDTGIFQPLKALHDLDLSYNEIRTINDDTFKNNINIGTLNLANNHLMSLHASVFRNNVNLQMLDISNCGLYKLWSDVKPENLSSIQNLNVSNNKILIIRKEDVAVTDNLKFIDLSGNPLNCTESYKELILYLTDHEVQNTQYTTHENIEYETFDERAKEMGIWKEQARKKCPEIRFEIITENPINEIYEIKEEIEIETHIAELNDPIIFSNDIADEEDENEEDESNIPKNYEYKSSGIYIYNNLRYAILWKLLIFLGTALLVVSVVVNVMLFIIRRHPNVINPRTIHIKTISKLKKNSGLVYQPLSEEHDPVKTPVLSRFGIPSVHQKSGPDNV